MEGKEKRGRTGIGGWLTRSDNRNEGEFYGVPSRREREREELLADFVGEERRAEVFASFRPPPKDIKNLLESILSEHPVEDIELLDGLKQNWASIVGGDNAKQCRPVSIDGKRLFVEVYMPAFMFVLRGQLKSVINKRLEAYTNGSLNTVILCPAAKTAHTNR
ncbi:MAG: DUF721 domain-containing protein [Victivallales bacterium]|nr:DUF721 domain-containing protein [Victivallales bacterium]